MGRPLGDVYTLGEVEIAANDGRFPNPQDANYNNLVRLVGYEYKNGRAPAPGETVELTLYWELLARPRANDVIAQVRLARDGQLLLGTDTPMSQYRRSVGNFIADTHYLTIPPDAPAGEYEVALYLFDIFTQNLSMIVAEDGHEIDNHLKLAKIRIR